MPAPHIQRDADGRPDFMVLLGVAPPYTEEDVKQAYFAKAKELHPDRGGNAHDFDALHKAFEQANQYLEFRRDSRGWIAKQMDGYLQSRTMVEQLSAFGAKVETSMIDWLQRSFGDFAELTDSIMAVRLENSNRAEDLIDLMLANQSAFYKLKRLELPGCELSDASVLRLEAFQQLQQLDLSNTKVTKTACGIIDALPTLVKFDVTDTNISWWELRKLNAQLRARREASPTLIS